MCQLFVPSGVPFIFTISYRFDDLLFDFLFQLYSKHIQHMHTVVVEPWLCDVEVDDGLAEVFKNEFHVCCVLAGQELLVSVDRQRGEVGDDLLELFFGLGLRHVCVRWVIMRSVGEFFIFDVKICLL